MYCLVIGEKIISKEELFHDPCFTPRQNQSTGEIQTSVHPIFHFLLKHSTSGAKSNKNAKFRLYISIGRCDFEVPQRAKLEGRTGHHQIVCPKS
jgi:hypothetical protein